MSPTRLATGLAAGALALAAGCASPAGPGAIGDAAAGARVIAALECGVCHTIPGVRGAHGIVGPDLTGFGVRAYIGGIAPNQPRLLAQWVRNAPSLAPETLMPAMPLSEREAHDVAAYLYTLR